MDELAAVNAAFLMTEKALFNEVVGNGSNKLTLMMEDCGAGLSCASAFATSFTCSRLAANQYRLHRVPAIFLHIR